MIMFFAGAGVMIAACYLLGFGVMAVAFPARASHYLHGFASSARAHWLELIARVAAGFAFWGYASHMPFPGAFHTFGLVLIVTTLGLAVLPWRWHQQFAQATVPSARPYLPVVGIVSIAAGAFVLWALASGLVA